MARSNEIPWGNRPSGSAPPNVILLSNHVFRMIGMAPANRAGSGTSVFRTGRSLRRLTS